MYDWIIVSAVAISCWFLVRDPLLLKRRLPESTISGGSSDTAVIFLMSFALPDSPPSFFNFQPHGFVSPVTLLENNTVSGGCLSDAKAEHKIVVRVKRMVNKIVFIVLREKVICQ